ncbi:hypothetical protein PHLGIDRAFT_124649 [Phlebiopsis gigantea 11061_1 CR5-6]|uniref:Uncharacterized protein n=1 Tax=Phlebiopsis gigantea (strain 11061_1 CR5-6) TaxID=745531 RepID=A0A0C3SDF0_PHLG1|nr:hypothetical protein PHLGIDRAFT_124649 [Phlebiopsis gigantea 11061_1 CR5-6]
MFRVSPWIPYDPNAEAQHDHSRSESRHRNMNEDVDMDAPQISTLREEETPEPQPNPSRQGKFRVKLVMNEGKMPAPVPGPSTKKAAGRETDDEDEEDDEEDQLIDDDDEESKAPPPPLPVVSAPPTQVEKPPTGAKRGTGIGRGRGGGRGRGRGARSKLGRSDGAPIMMIGTEGLGTITIPPPNSISAPAAAPRKRGGGPKAAGQRSTRGKRAPKTATAVPSHLRDDAGSISETYAGTAASSPGHEEASPESHDVALPSFAIPLAPAPSMEDISLEGVPLPSYPLPTKPFAVHPPPKIPTGLAANPPLDKGGKKVRHWRQANREVRGIAGGRWFVKTWIGDKDSEYGVAHATAPPPIPAATQATALAMASGDRDLLPGLSSVPRLTTSTRGRGRGGLATNSSSRAQSTGADSVSAPKRRTTAQAVDSPLSMSISTS